MNQKEAEKVIKMKSVSACDALNSVNGSVSIGLSLCVQIISIYFICLFI